MTVSIFDDRRCELGEGPLWHPLRQQLFWFDITGAKLLTRDGARTRAWSFAEPVSAAGWVSERELLVASASALSHFDIESGEREKIAALEPDKPDNRSNDGRADPFGGFWIGTMSIARQTGAGAIWRYHRGSLTRLFDNLTIPNAICFSPDGATAYFADTPRHAIFKVALDPKGWPRGEPEIFVDLAPENLNPDGAVVDAEGALWNAQWGAGRIARYRPNGEFDRAIAVPASQPSCPAFGGPALDRLFATSAMEGLDEARRAGEPASGMVFEAEAGVTGQAEHRVVI